MEDQALGKQILTTPSQSFIGVQASVHAIKLLTLRMNELLILSGVVLLWLGAMIVEYRNHLWSEIVSCGDPIPDKSGDNSSIQMVFFWRSAPTFKQAQDGDYWNSMGVSCLTDGVLITRPIFLFGRRTVFLPWSKLEVGEQFRAWLAQRRAIRIKGTDLYLSISEKVYRNQSGSHIRAKS